jgi:hypothetical protein
MLVFCVPGHNLSANIPAKPLTSFGKTGKTPHMVAPMWAQKPMGLLPDIAKNADG